MLDSVMLVTDQDLKARAGLPADDIQCEYHFPVSPIDLGRLAARFGIRQDSQTITPLVEQASSSFYRGLLRYLFMTDGTVADNQADGVQVRLAHVDLELLRAAQRMLLRLGIVSSIRDSRPLDGKGGGRGRRSGPA